MCTDENVRARLKHRQETQKTGRIDDTEECLNYRLKNFAEETSKVYKEFQKHNRFFEIDANGPKEAVRQAALDEVRHLLQ